MLSTALINMELHTAVIDMHKEWEMNLYSEPLTQGLGMPIQAPFQFVGGLVKGLVGDNNLTELQTCATDSGAVVTAVE